MRFAFILIPLLTGCASTGPDLSCEGTNWYELGRQVGRQGQALEDRWDLRAVCGNDRSLYRQSFAILETGYQAGLSEYCSPENAFTLGRLGLGRTETQCPERFHLAYVSAYKRGQSYARLEKSKMNTDQKIRVISDELGASGLSLAKRALREGQRLELLEKKSDQTARLKALQESAKSSAKTQ